MAWLRVCIGQKFLFPCKLIDIFLCVYVNIPVLQQAQRIYNIKPPAGQIGALGNIFQWKIVPFSTIAISK